MAAEPSVWPQADVEAPVVETHSLYTSTAWMVGKKPAAPPIFTNLGFRHPHCIEFDIRLRDQTRPEDLLEFVRAEIRRFDAGNVVIALAALPKLLSSGQLDQFLRHQGWTELEDRVRSCVNRLEPRGLAMVLYAMARLLWRDGELLRSLTEGVEKRIPDFSAADVAKVSWSLAKLGVYDRVKGLWVALAKEGAKKCTSGSFIDISMTAWAFVSVGFPDKALFGQLATAAIERREELPPQTISNLAWAFAKGRIKNEQLFDVLADRSVACAADFDRQGIANTLWAFATLGIAREDVFTALVSFTLESSIWRKFSPQMASNVLWACSRAGITDVQLFDAMAEFIREHADRLDNQNISNLAWAYAVAELPSKSIFSSLTSAAMQRLSGFRLDELCGLLWAFTRGKAVDSPIFEDAFAILVGRARELDSQGLSNLIWISATVGHQRGAPIPGSRELVDSLLAQILDLHVRLDSEGAAMTTWALWRAGRFHDAWLALNMPVFQGEEDVGPWRQKLIAIQKVHKQRMKDGHDHPFPRLRWIVLSQTFEWAMAVLIISNCVAIGWQAEQREPTGVEATVNTVLEHFFTAAFSGELLLRILAFGWTMVLDSENHLDLFLVSLSVLAAWILGPAQVSVEMLRKLTVLRTLRLVRLAAAVRFRPEFKDMWALLKGLYESVETLFWTYVMIGCVLYFFAIMATSLIGKQDAFRDNEIAQEYFGDVGRSMLSLFQVMTLDSWSAVVRELMAVQTWVVFFFVLFISIAVFVLMNLVTAIIVEHAFSNGKADEQDRAVRLEREKEQELEELHAFFEMMDEDKSGKITQSELYKAARHRKVRQKLRALDIMPKDMDDLWDILDDGDGELDVDEFVNGIRRLRGEARAKDILRIQKELRMLERSVNSIEESMDVSSNRMKVIEQNLQRALSDISAVQRTIGRAREAVKIAAKTQRMKDDPSMRK